jgi:hypothetical protein
MSVNIKTVKLEVSQKAQDLMILELKLQDLEIVFISNNF